MASNIGSECNQGSSCKYHDVFHDPLEVEGADLTSILDEIEDIVDYQAHRQGRFKGVCSNSPFDFPKIYIHRLTPYKRD